MKKFLLSIMLVCVLAVCSHADVKPAKIGVLAPIGQDENDVIKWSENIAEAEGKSRTFKNHNVIVIYDDLNSMIMALRAGQIDRFSITEYTAEYITSRNPEFELIDNNHNPIIGYALAIREEDRKQLMGINLAINDMRADGTLERLIRENIIDLGDKEPVAYDMPKIEGAEVLKVAVTGDLPPMDCILADGRPAGFNTAFLAELSRRIKKNFKLVSISAGARQAAISSGRVDILFWTRGVYNSKLEPLPYPLDKTVGVSISQPYLLGSRTAVKLKK